MTLTVERDGPVTTIIRSRIEARNAMDPASAEALTEALLAFDRDPRSRSRCCSARAERSAPASTSNMPPRCSARKTRWRRWIFRQATEPVPRGPMGPTRLQLSKPVIAAVAGPAVAGGMELALWCDLRVMEQSAYMGVYCRRWGVPLIDGGTVRLPRIVGRGRALDIILTGRKVPARGMLSHRPVRAPRARRREPRGGAKRWRTRSRAFRKAACAPTAARSGCRRACPRWTGCASEWACSSAMVEREGAAGAARFASGKGRHGDFGDI